MVDGPIESIERGRAVGAGAVKNPLADAAGMAWSRVMSDRDDTRDDGYAVTDGGAGTHGPRG